MLSSRGQERKQTHLVLFHHLPDPAALLANDEAMELVRDLHIFRDWNQCLEWRHEEN